MSIIAINPDAVFEYSLNDDTGDDKTIFILGVIDSSTRAYIDDTHSVMDRENDAPFSDVSIHDKYLQFVRFGLRGWKNFKDSEGKDVPFETEEMLVPRVGKRTVVKESCLHKIELKYIVELGLQIITHNQLTGTDKKN